MPVNSIWEGVGNIMVLALQAALLCQSAPGAVADAFCESRLAGHWGQTFGTLGAGTDFDRIIDRAIPRKLS